MSLEKNDASNEMKVQKRWATGRLLTKEQRARKREVDRLAQEKKRTRAQDRIFELEATVRLLLQDPANARGDILIDGLEALRSDNEKLSTTVGAIVNTADPATAREHGRAVPTPNYEPSQAGEARRAFATAQEAQPETSDACEIVRMSSAAEDIWQSPYLDNVTGLVSPPGSPLSRRSSAADNASHAPSTPSSFDSHHQEISGLYGLHQPQFSSDKSAADELSISRTCNALVSQTKQLRTTQICMDDAKNQEALINGILNGWDSLEQMSYWPFCPLWQILRKIDECVFTGTPIIERLVMLRTVHSMLLCRVRAETWRELPTWYRPRPTQFQFPHQEVTDYFAWPGLRERLVLSHQNTLTNQFWRQFSGCFRFYWPYQLLDALCIDPLTHNLRFSNAFQNQMREIRMWQMDLSFFDAYPALYDDITPVTAVPPLLSMGLNGPESWAVNNSPPRILPADSIDFEEDEDSRE